MGSCLGRAWGRGTHPARSESGPADGHLVLASCLTGGVDVPAVGYPEDLWHPESRTPAQGRCGRLGPQLLRPANSDKGGHRAAVPAPQGGLQSTICVSSLRVGKQAGGSRASLQAHVLAVTCAQCCRVQHHIRRTGGAGIQPLSQGPGPGAGVRGKSERRGGGSERQRSTSDRTETGSCNHKEEGASQRQRD